MRSAVARLLQAADVPAGWERIQATKHCLVLAEKLAAAGKNELAQKIYQHLRDTRTGLDEGYIRTLAEESLQA